MAAADIPYANAQRGPDQLGQAGAGWKPPRPPTPIRPYDLNSAAGGSGAYDINKAVPEAQPGPAAQPASPLDSTYFGNVAANQFRVGNQLNSLQQQGQFANVDLQAALAKLAYQQPRDELKLEQGANRGGSLYSSVYGQNLGNLNYGYLGRTGGLVDNAAKGEAARNSQMAALRGGIPLYNAQQYAAAASRASVAAQKNPATGESNRPLVKAIANKGKGMIWDRQRRA